MAKTKVVICPYCGETQPADERCRACSGLFEPLSRRATHNAMGPWFLRDPARPFQPGCSYETLVGLIDRAVVTKYSVVRGPTSKQFWTIARHVPGIAHLLGYCHACDAEVDATDHGCHTCGAPFGAYLDRNYLGLPEVQAMPWDAGGDGEELGDSAWTGGETGGWTRPTAGAGGRISSFAPDEELLRPAPARVPDEIDASEAPSIAAAGPPPAGVMPPGPPRATIADELGSPAVQSMRRRLAGQARVIRTLWFCLALALAAAAVELVLLLVR